jgi:hypothetical protein
VQTAARLPNRRTKKYVPAAFVAMHIGWGLGLWTGLVRNGLAALRRQQGRQERQGSSG